MHNERHIARSATGQGHLVQDEERVFERKKQREERNKAVLTVIAAPKRKDELPLTKNKR